MNKGLSEDQIKRDVCDIGRRMYMNGFVAANDGNISVKINDNEIITTPTGVSKGFMTPEMLCNIDLDGNVIRGNTKPSSEIKMHLRVYQENPEIKAVTHSHSPYATAFAIARTPLDKALLPEAIVNLGSVPVAEYATPGTNDVSESIAEFVMDYNCVLLANHGAVTWGTDLMQAYFRMETLEYYAKILFITTMLGNAKELSCNDISSLLQIRQKQGITTGGVPAKCNDVQNSLDAQQSSQEDLLVQRVTDAVLKKLTDI
ncbi:class II aldolase/adducin family protein [Wukongibacter baidiensis]|uniref:class II aldolase/adducin family protein n=1 Tax=Wukongibacter baidiensis TaxID=1723361 RepID=UPI003D7FA766